MPSCAERRPRAAGSSTGLKRTRRNRLFPFAGENDPDALRCELTYRFIRTDGEKSLLEIELMTGRTHQIRVQMAAAGYPVLGDDKYGDRAFNKSQKRRSQALLAKRLETRRTCVRELKGAGTVIKKRFSNEKRFFIMRVGSQGRALARELEGGALNVF